jgi:hypothetical protein
MIWILIPWGLFCLIGFWMVVRDVCKAVYNEYRKRPPAPPRQGGGIQGGGGGAFAEEATRYRAEHLEEILEGERLVQNMFKPIQRGVNQADARRE